MTDNDNRIGIDTHGMSEQEITECDKCELECDRKNCQKEEE